MFKKQPPPPPPGPKPGFHASNFKPTSQLVYELQNEDAQRNELFAGAEPNQQLGPGGERTVDQLVDEAVDTHQATTKAAQRALRVLEQTKQVQVETIAELEDQSKKMNTLNNKLNQVNQDLTYSERLLRYMRRCCCCILCDSCTGADPETQREKKWAKQVDKGKTSKFDNVGNVTGNKQGGGMGPGGAKPGAPGSAQSGGTYRDPDIRLTEQHKATELQLNQETRKQNEILDQIHNGLGDLLNNARVMREELEDQNEGAAQLQSRFEQTQDRLHQVNNKSQLRKFR